VEQISRTRNQVRARVENHLGSEFETRNTQNEVQKVMKNRSVTNILHALILVVGSLFMFAGSAMAAEGTSRANIPFDFKVGGTTFAAGEYTIERVSVNSHELLALRDSSGKRRAIINGVRVERLGKYSEPRFVFTKYAQANVLSEIWLSATESGVSVPKTRFEQELLLENAGAGKQEAITISGK
jgi:hypothetical protein